MLRRKYCQSFPSSQFQKSALFRQGSGIITVPVKKKDEWDLSLLKFRLFWDPSVPSAYLRPGKDLSVLVDLSLIHI